MAMLAIAATVISAIGAIQQGQAAAGAAKYNQQVAQQNAGIATAQGQAAYEQQQRTATASIGQTIAAAGASGVDPGTGSPTDVLADATRQKALGGLTVKYDYALRALGYQDNSNLYGSQAANDTTAGYLNAAGDIASGAGRYQLYTQGGGNPLMDYGLASTSNAQNNSALGYG